MYKGEFFNSISHIVGAAAALAGLTTLVALSTRQEDPWKIVSFSIYGATLFMAYFFSALYHSLRGKAKTIFRRLDHFSIYLLIAGTYTPFVLVTLRGAWGWSLFGSIWGMAIAGILIDIFLKKNRRIVPGIIYLIMGWMCLVAIKPLTEALPQGGFAWLLAGGIFYTTGIIFFAFDKKVQHFHGIWHIFVLLGSFSHYFSVLFYVL